MSDKLREALEDALSGWKYVREHHGDLYGVGWDRVQHKLEAALAQPQNDVQGHKKLADDLERLCCAETEAKFFDLVTDSIQTIIEALRRPAQPQNDAEVEPVAWQWMVHGDWITIDKHEAKDPEAYARSMSKVVRPIYTAPPSPERMREALFLFREFIDHNVRQWTIGAGDSHHPIWALISEALGDHVSRRATEAEWSFIQPHNREALSRAGDNHASDGKHDPAFVASILEADAKPPEAVFGNIDDTLAYLNKSDNHASDGKESDGAFQSRVQPWMMACFGPEISADKIERNHRFLEEALELVQACGCTQDEAHQLVDYVYGRDQGDINQEVGGVMVTLAALCLANGFDMHGAGETELARIWTKVEKIRAKQAAKPKHSPLPGPSDPTPPDRKLPSDDLGLPLERVRTEAARMGYALVPNDRECCHLSKNRTTGFDPYSDFVCNDCGAPC